jgi:type IV pilus assembly protein PilV
MNHGKTIAIGRTSGESLLEVMIAMLVFSVGVIGIATMMLTSMRQNDATLARTNATILANEMYENMLANLTGTKDGSYNLSMESAIPRTSSYDCEDSEFNPDPDCDTTQLANWELGRWGKRFNDVLHYGDASIAVDTSVDPAIIEIQVRYLPLQEVAGTTTETFTFRAR